MRGDHAGTQVAVVGEERDTNRVAENPVMLPCWSISRCFTLTRDVVYALLGDDISDIRGDNGDSFQICPTSAFPDLAGYAR